MLPLADSKKQKQRKLRNRPGESRKDFCLGQSLGNLRLFDCHSECARRTEESTVVLVPFGLQVRCGGWPGGVAGDFDPESNCN